MRVAFAILTLLWCSAGAFWAADARSPADHAAICWSHNVSQARHLSRESGKPIFWIDEVSARALLRGPLAHPIVVDAANDLFTPLINCDGAPNAVAVGFTDGDGRSLSNNLTGDVAAPQLLARMIAALKAAHRDVPAYLQLVADEYNPASPQTATFAVGCYWEGERQIGKLNGILATRTGTIGGDEVVQVRYDATRVDYASVLHQVGAMQCFRSIVAPGDANLRPGEVQQFTLAQFPEYCYLPLTPLQATKINTALAQGTDADLLLSPTQRAMHAQLRGIVARRGDESLKNLKVDRSIDGLAQYSQALRRTITQLGGS